MHFVKPGKGNALYKCKLRNLLARHDARPHLQRGDSLEGADVTEIEAQFLYRQQDMFVFMDNVDYEQYELTKEQVDDAWKYLKEGMVARSLFFNNNPHRGDAAEPRRAEGRIRRAGRARATRPRTCTKPVKLETGAEIRCPAFVDIGDIIRVDTRTGEYIERARSTGSIDNFAVPPVTDELTHLLTFRFRWS